MEQIAFYVSAAALALGGLLGLKGMTDPAWAARIVRLEPAPGKPEGRGEFRATFGGMFLALHAAAFAALFAAGPEAGHWACAILAAGWLGTAIARFWSMLADAGVAHPHTRMSILIECAAGLLIAVWPLSALSGGA